MANKKAASQVEFPDIAFGVEKERISTKLSLL